MKLKKQLIAVQWKNGKRSEAELNPNLDYYFHAHFYPADENGIDQYLISLTEQNPDYNEPCWLVNSWVFGQLRIIQTKKKR